MRGSIHKVMNRVKNLLSDIISRAKEVLTIDPGNAAALKAKRLAEAQRRTLQDEYFAHAEKGHGHPAGQQKKTPQPSKPRARRKDAVFVFRSRRMPTERATSKLMKIS